MILGDTEIERGVLQIKDLVAHLQEEIPLEECGRVLADRALEASPGGQRGAR